MASGYSSPSGHGRSASPHTMHVRRSSANALRASRSMSLGGASGGSVSIDFVDLREGVMGNSTPNGKGKGKAKEDDVDMEEGEDLQEELQGSSSKSATGKDPSTSRATVSPQDLAAFEAHKVTLRKAIRLHVKRMIGFEDISQLKNLKPLRLLKGLRCSSKTCIKWITIQVYLTLMQFSLL